MEYLIIGLFCITLSFCVLNSISTIIALSIGYILFFGYGLYRKITPLQLWKASLSSIIKVKNILITFILIGSMTALWRASGTIASFVYYTGTFIQPSIFILLTFLMNCLISFITGSSLCTASTMGVISMTIGLSMGLNPAMLGGAMLSGAYFGDRCSPVSTSALLVSTITNTNLYKNIQLMLKTSIVPIILTCILYLICGLSATTGSYNRDILSIFNLEYTIHIICLLPAIVIIILALCKVDVKKTLLVSIVISFILCITLQNISIIDTLKIIIFGYQTKYNELSHMMGGGGIQSMLKVGCIVGIASSYSGLFDCTGLLLNFKKLITTLATYLPKFLVIILTSIVTVMIACNQTLAIMLTRELCSDLKQEQELAIDIENSTVVIAAIIPWSIACVSPLSATNAPTTSILFGFYLFILPIYQLLKQSRQKGL